jgi:hypothetical protein
MTDEHDWTRGMSAEIAALFGQQPVVVQRAYLEFYANRRMRKAAHRDTLEAFIAGWATRGRLTATTRARKAA